MSEENVQGEFSDFEHTKQASGSCVICKEPAKFYCSHCGSSTFCEKHICAHWGEMIRPKEDQTQSSQSFSVWIMAVLVIIGAATIVGYLFSSLDAGVFIKHCFVVFMVFIYSHDLASEKQQIGYALS